MRPPAFLVRVRDWLMVGYPDGIPTKDYNPVLALLRREHLTDDEVAEIAHELHLQGRLPTDRQEPFSHAELVAAIHERLREEPSPDEVARVEAILRAGDWPFSTDPAGGPAATLAAAAASDTAGVDAPAGQAAGHAPGHAPD